MARRCVTDNTPGLCCAAASKGIASGQFFTHPDARTGKLRCHVCTVIQRTKGRGMGFQHRFAKSGQCNIVSGCAALQPAGGQGFLTLPAGGGATGVPTV
jgi:hypothetical protein